MATRIRLRIACPVCIDDGRDGAHKRPYNWVHAADDGELYINEYGTISCLECSDTWNIVNSLWGCPNHSYDRGQHQYEYKRASYEATVLAISNAALLLKGHASAAWFQRLLINIQQFG